MRVKIAPAVLVVVVALGGCSAPTHTRLPVENVVTTAPPEALPEPVASPTPAATTLTKAAPRRSPIKRVRVARPSIARFVAAVQRQMPQFVLDRRDEEVAELGTMACRSLRAGKTKAAVANEITEYGVGSRDARGLVTLARGAGC
jgi:uncharacterized protein DUF732